MAGINTVVCPKKILNVLIMQKQLNSINDQHPLVKESFALCIIAIENSIWPINLSSKFQAVTVTRSLVGTISSTRAKNLLPQDARRCWKKIYLTF